MKPFLHDIAEILIRNHGADFSEVGVVLPSKRSGLFLKKHLSELIGKAFFPPRIVTMTELFSEWSGLKAGDPSELLFLLYESYCEAEKEKAENFDRFLRWGNMLLNDFNDIDRYLVNTTAIFRDLRNIKSQELEIESWSFEEQELSENQERYLEFWNSMPVIYEAYNKRLDEMKLAYSGKLYRDVAENIVERTKNENRHFYFAGFNALSNAEQKILAYLADSGKADLFFDADPYYTDDPQHEAGMFFRRIRSAWKGRGFELMKEHFRKGPKKIEIINAPGNIAQARVAGQILSEKGDVSDTALVLANEQLLLPVLNSLPESVGKVNVTMGFPLRSSDLFQLYQLVLDLQQSRKDAGGKDKGGFYYRPFLDFLFHPVIRQYLGNEAETIRKQITERKKVFITNSDLQKFSSKRFNSLLFLVMPWKNFPADALDAFVMLNDLLRDFYLQELPDPLALEYVFHLNKVVERLQELCKKYPYISEFHSFRSLLRQYVLQLDISFVGEPLEGLQLMGMLETRSLDFKNLVLLSVNEDVLPKSKWEHSFILYEVKRYHGMPTYKDRDALYANHFYRLLQRAENVWLIYNSDTESFSGGEKSRFVQQLQEELPRYNPEVNIRERILRLPVNSNSPVRGVKKTDAILSAVRQHLANGISPSALNSFVACPLNFYYRYILGIKEQEEMDDVSDHAIVGNVIHRVLEQQYTPFIGKTITTTAIEKMRHEAADLALEMLGKEVGAANVEEGNYYLLHRVAHRFLDHFYTEELLDVAGSSITILGVEETLEREFVRDGLVVRIKGKADRIDLRNGVVRIIDYKSGNFSRTDIQCSNEEDIRKKAKALQLMSYAWAYIGHSDRRHLSISSGIYPLRSAMPVECLSVDKKSVFTADDFLHFEDVMLDVVQEMLDPESDFVHLPESRFCKLCE